MCIVGLMYVFSWSLCLGCIEHENTYKEAIDLQLHTVGTSSRKTSPSCVKLLQSRPTVACSTCTDAPCALCV